MINNYKKSFFLILFIFISLLSGCGESSTAQTSSPTNNLTSTAQSLISTAQSLRSRGIFTTLPPGIPLPTDAECAASVKQSSWEPRPENTTANNTNVYTQGHRLKGSYLKQYGYEQRVTGNFTGTTDEILQWAACKWGIDENIVRAQAIEESYWRQSTLGDCRGPTQPETHGCESVGILQVKGADVPPTHPGTWPYAYESTAFNADYAYAVWRACYDGKETWLGKNYHAGDVWGCVGRWYSGDWYIHSLDYIAAVKGYQTSQPWLKPGF